MRPYSSSSKGRRNKNSIVFGKTALENIRRSLDRFKLEKDRELFSRLQHRINTEYIKSKANDDFHKRDIRLNTAYQFIKEQQKFIRLDNQVKNLEKFQNHSCLYNKENKKRAEKILKYINEYKIKEKRVKLIRSQELNKKMENNKGYPQDIISKRLDDIRLKGILRHKALKVKLSEKDVYLNKYKEEKEKKLELKRKESENILKLRNYRINQLFSELNKKREEKRKEMDKKNRDIEIFISEKEKINDQKRNIIDIYNNKYHMYSDRIDSILFKKDLNQRSINQIQFMSSNEPALAGLGQNLN